MIQRNWLWMLMGIVCAIVGVAVWQSQTAQAAQTAPVPLNFQGKLVDASGSPVQDGLYNIRFRAYLNDPTGGVATWTETHDGANRVQVTNGIFNTQIGAISPFSASSFTVSTFYIEIELPTVTTAQCDGLPGGLPSCIPSWTEGPMAPRQPIASTAYAMNADLIDGIDGADLAQLGSSNTVTGATIFRPASDSTTAFQIQKSDNTPLLVADTQNLALKVGGGDVSPDASPALLVLDYKNTSGDPSGTNGAMYYNSNTNKSRCYEGGQWKDCVYSERSIREGFNYLQDFFSAVNFSVGFFPSYYIATLDSTIAVFGNGSGASVQSQTSEPNYPGIWRMGTGTTATGNSFTSSTFNGTNLTFPYRLGEGAWTFDAGVRLPTLSGVSSQNYLARAGLVQAIGSVAHGCMFRYDSTTSSNWIGVCGNGTSETTCDTGLAVAANTWYKLKFVVNSAGSSVEFFADNGGSPSSCPVPSNIPTADNLAVLIGIAKTVGTTARFMDLDYLDFTYDTTR